MLIDCDTCAARNLHCSDCVVGVLLSGRGDSLELDSAEESALGAFARGGLLPPLRLVPSYRAGDSEGKRVEREKPNGGRTAIA